MTLNEALGVDARVSGNEGEHGSWAYPLHSLTRGQGNVQRDAEYSLRGRSRQSRHLGLSSIAERAVPERPHAGLPLRGMASE